MLKQRTIKEIKQDIGRAYIENELVRSAYKLKDGKSFEEQFSQSSLESLLFWAVASVIWTLERLFLRHRQEVEGLLLDLRPHTLHWYEEKAKNFMFGFDLIKYTDHYNLLDRRLSLSKEVANNAYKGGGLLSEKIGFKQGFYPFVVAYAVAEEDDNLLRIKVAGADADLRPRLLNREELSELKGYLNEIKDAGVLIDLVSKGADKMNLEVDVYVFEEQLRNKNTLESEIKKQVAKVLYQLPFDGRYRNSDLVETIEEIRGVEAAYIVKATAKAEGWNDPVVTITAYHKPSAGYYALDRLTLNFKLYGA